MVTVWINSNVILGVLNICYGENTGPPDRNELHDVRYLYELFLVKWGPLSHQIGSVNTIIRLRFLTRMSKCTNKIMVQEYNEPARILRLFD